MISGKENFTRAIERRSPEYLPCMFSCMLHWIWDKDPAKQARVKQLAGQVPDDRLTSLECWPYRYSPGGALHWTDQFGTQWTKEGYGARVEAHALADGYEGLADFDWPDPHEPGRFADADAKLTARGDRYCRADVWFTLFGRMWHLRGYDNTLMDPYLHPQQWQRLRDKIVEIDLALIDQWVARGVDGIFMEDDWGTQRAMLISPDDWRRLYKPSYAKLFQRARDGGAHVWYHSCGHITPIIGDLIDIGVSVLNPIQPQAMDIAELARQFGGKVCFYGGIDSQGVLVTGSPEDVKAAVRRTVDTLSSPDGGYIAAPSQTLMPETPLDNIIAAYEALAEYR